MRPLVIVIIASRRRRLLTALLTLTSPLHNTTTAVAAPARHRNLKVPRLHEGDGQLVDAKRHHAAVDGAAAALVLQVLDELRGVAWFGVGRCFNGLFWVGICRGCERL